MADDILIKRGLKATLPTLKIGELGYCTDSKELFIGTSTGNDLIQDSAAEILAKLGISSISGTNTGDETASTIKTKLSISTLSGSNTGDETATTIKSKLSISTLSGSNTGDETATTIKTKLGISTLSGSNTGDETLDSIAADIAAGTEKAVPIDADYILLMDSADSNKGKKVSISAIRALGRTIDGGTF
jgi:hypothetical protein